MSAPREENQNELREGLREMTEDEVIEVFKTLDLPLAPTETTHEVTPLVSFHVTGDSR